MFSSIALDLDLPVGPAHRTRKLIMYNDVVMRSPSFIRSDNVNSGNLSGNHLFSIIDLKIIINRVFFTLNYVESTGFKLSL